MPHWMQADRAARELRRGMITLTVMLSLQTENHGYALRQTLRKLGLPLEEGTLYPLLKRLEEQSVLTSRWDATGDRARRFYALTTIGHELLRKLDEQWRHLIAVVEAAHRPAEEFHCRTPMETDDVSARAGI